MTTAAPTFAFTQLIQPTVTVSSSPPPAPFNAGMAYLMGQVCNLTYQQFGTGSVDTSDFAPLVLSGYTVSATAVQPFTVSEALAPGAVPGQPGYYVQVPAGFGAQLTLTPTSGGTTQNIVVIAIRGTRSFDEWYDDAESLPTVFAAQSPDGLGSVHAGFYAYYVVGTNGSAVLAANALSPDPASRAQGSIAQQVATFVSSLPASTIYITGHSLGGAIASFVALDIAHNFARIITNLLIYTLASPRVALGLSEIPTLDNQNGFLDNYQTLVPNSYAIVHAADIIPILPASITVGPLKLTCAQVTDPYQAGSGAAATATIGNGSVTSITVDNTNSSGYSASFPLQVSITGGGGSGASGSASVSLFGNVSCTLISGGSGYTSPPTVQIVSGGSLARNVVSFCAQTGDIENNHGCAATYVPYLALLAAGLGS